MTGNRSYLSLCGVVFRPPQDVAKGKDGDHRHRDRRKTISRRKVKNNDENEDVTADQISQQPLVGYCGTVFVSFADYLVSNVMSSHSIFPRQKDRRISSEWGFCSNLAEKPFSNWVISRRSAKIEPDADPRAAILYPIG